MKRNATAIITIIILSFINLSALFSQQVKLRDYFNPKEVKDYDTKVKENKIYPEEMRFIVHNFEIYMNNQFIDKGKIYRQFFKNGLYETFFTTSEKKLFNVSYWSDPTALVVANTNKSEYCVEKNINNILFPMVIRGYAKILKSGSVDKQFKNIRYKLTKIKSSTENEVNKTSFNVTSVPKVVEGTIETINGLIITQGDLIIDNDLAKRSGLKLILSHSDLPNMSRINLKFDCQYIDLKKPGEFHELGIETIIQKYEKIECD